MQLSVIIAFVYVAFVAQSYKVTFAHLIAEETQLKLRNL